MTLYVGDKMNKPLKTIKEMHDIEIDELEEYAHELYLLWAQACKIRDYRNTIESDRILLNTEVIEIELLENKEDDDFEYKGLGSLFD